MSDQAVSMLVGLSVIVALRLLDWAFPKGYVWRKVKDWSEPIKVDQDDDEKEEAP